MTSIKKWGVQTVARIVSISGAFYALLADDGNGPVGEGVQNTQYLVPAHPNAVEEADTLEAGFYRVRVNRLLAMGASDNEYAVNALASVIAHPNSEYLGKSVALGPQSKAGTSYPVGNGYLGARTGGASSPGGWTIVYWDGSYTPPEPSAP